MQIRKLVGTKKFYKMVFFIAFPIMIQSCFTQMVNVLDNIMVGQVGTDEMSAVAIANQLIFVFNLLVFGGISGASIFGAQFYGHDDHIGVRNAFRFKIIICIILSIIGLGIFSLYDKPLISYYLHEGSKTGNLLRTLRLSRQYLSIMLIGLPPFAISQAYATSLRETDETVLPMKSSIAAVLTNLAGNYILIFGHFGAPVLGVEGAAIATVLSRFVELSILVICTHAKHDKHKFIVGAYRSLKIPLVLTKRIISRGWLLLANEGLWSVGIAVLAQGYSLRGLAAVAGYNISSTLSNLFNVTFFAMGSAIAIIIGNLLGAGKMKLAKETDYRLIALSVVCCVFVGILMLIISPFFPLLYNTTRKVRFIASGLIIVSACTIPLRAFMHATYFTLRSGGKTFITFLFDSVFLWCINIPLAYILAKYTQVDIIIVFAVSQGVDIFKCMLGFHLVKKGVWINNIISDTNDNIEITK